MKRRSPSFLHEFLNINLDHSVCGSFPKDEKLHESYNLKLENKMNWESVAVYQATLVNKGIENCTNSKQLTTTFLG